MKYRHALLTASVFVAASFAAAPADAQIRIPSNPFGNKDNQSEQSSGSTGISGAATDVVLGEIACKASKNEGFMRAAASEVMPNTYGLGDGLLDGAFNFASDLLNRNASPYCSVDTSVGALLLTAAMIDEATLSAALAVDKAQEALGLQRSLVQDINALRQNQGLGNPMASIDDDGMARTERVGNAAVVAAAQLKALELAGWQTPEMEAAAQELASNLSSSTWLQVQVIAGAKTSSDLIGSLNSEQQEQLLVDPNVGVTSEFVKLAPQRFKDALGNLGKIATVTAALNTVTDRKLLKKIEKSEKQGTKDAKKAAKALGKSADEFVFSMQ
jgi:hypothetical protein